MTVFFLNQRLRSNENTNRVQESLYSKVQHNFLNPLVQDPEVLTIWKSYFQWKTTTLESLSEFSLLGKTSTDQHQNQPPKTNAGLAGSPARPAFVFVLLHVLCFGMLVFPSRVAWCIATHMYLLLLKNCYIISTFLRYLGQIAAVPAGLGGLTQTNSWHRLEGMSLMSSVCLSQHAQKSQTFLQLQTPALDESNSLSLCGVTMVSTGTFF